MVLLHGYGLSGRYMLPLARALAGRYAVYVPDLPGHGQSRPGGYALSIRGLAQALGDWVDAVGLARPTFVANSMGCQVVTQLAVDRPERVGSMILSGPTVDPARRGARHQIFGVMRESRHEPPRLVAITAGEWAGRNMRQLVVTARSALSDRIEDRLPVIGHPTVVLHGAQDRLVSRAWAERVAGLLPRGRLVVVPGEPHALPYTRPDLVARIVGSLIAEWA